ncbi:hypothetical protein BHM03_00052988 [Ensete ventricosum]|uniref:BZIP domain-containing protein n=1 Tax=Ensete ventricosum TaxID=4639 RepID=A0A445MM10_ENSVE|nr:hypothetical protein BHM03_00052988 [Ensete ventricosum]
MGHGHTKTDKIYMRGPGGRGEVEVAVSGIAGINTVSPPSCLFPLADGRTARSIFALRFVTMSVLLDLDFLLDESEPALTRGNNTPPVRVAETRRLAVSVEEERRRLRIISNRESARRSRIRSRRQLEGLRSEADRLRAQNRAAAGRLGHVNRSVLLFRRDNERLRSESAALRWSLAEIRRLVLLCWWLRRLPLPSAAVGGGYLPGKECRKRMGAENSSLS